MRRSTHRAERKVLSSRTDPGLGAAWARLIEQTPSKIGPQLLVAFFNGWLAARSGMITAQSVGPVDVVPPMVAGVWFYGVVLLRLWRAGPLGRSFVGSLANLWILFIGYTIWLGFLPPRKGDPAIGWVVWLLVLVVAGAALVVVPVDVEARQY
jgi:hypothetical protein